MGCKHTHHQTQDSSEQLLIKGTWQDALRTAINTIDLIVVAEHGVPSKLLTVRAHTVMVETCTLTFSHSPSPQQRELWHTMADVAVTACISDFVSKTSDAKAEWSDLCLTVIATTEALLGIYENCLFLDIVVVRNKLRDIMKSMCGYSLPTSALISVIRDIIVFATNGGIREMLAESDASEVTEDAEAIAIINALTTEVVSILTKYMFVITTHV